MAVVDLGEMAMLRYGADGDVPVCPRCSALVSPLDHYCAECEAPLGLTTSIPFVDIWAAADFEVRFIDIVTGGRSWLRIVLVGLVLLGAGAPVFLLLTPVLPVWWLRRRP